MVQPIAKIFEGILADQITHHFEINSLFCNQQHGFRAGHSCETALQTILNDWKVDVSMKDIIIALFVDFRKAFHLIDLKLFLRKLFHYGFDNSALDLAKSIVTGHSQITKVDNVLSEPLDLDHFGFREGAKLAPLFFFINTNDFGLAFSCFLSTCLYADDTTIYHYGPELDPLLSSFNAIFIQSPTFIGLDNVQSDVNQLV